jgi:hypothetical protein
MEINSRINKLTIENTKEIITEGSQVENVRDNASGEQTVHIQKKQKSPN